MNRRQRFAIVVGGAALAIGAAVVVALAWPTGHSARRAGGFVATTTTRRTTTARPVSTTHPPSTTTALAGPRLVAHAMPGEPAVGAAPATTTPPTMPGSPWPPGTVVSYEGTQGSIVFSPATAPVRTEMSYVATITNPADHWLFVPLNDWSGFSVYLWTPQTEDDYRIPIIVKGVDPTAPEFQHATPAGPKMGLLLAPHGSYSFSGRANNDVQDEANADYVGHADIIFTPPGVADAIGKVARDAGRFTVLVPPATTTIGAPTA